LLFTALFWIIVTAPIGALFGVLTTRGLVRRLHRLVSATAQFANGDYTQRVPVTRQDEIGQLESQFNQMAEQLVQSMAQRQALIEQNARLEERTRIEQELSTAHLIQHSLLPKEVPALAGWQIATYYQSAREVGGDLYDFLIFEDGRLGLVIGDVADKGVPAAMVMASTRSMLRAAAQVTDSPGEVLARVNDLLYADIPPNMFVTCFYALLDPGSGKLRYANAGHDLPYQRDAGKVCELRATGMPLGLMPEMRYEEKEVIIALDESILFYSDGLVEAHNPEREMFGFPRLQALLEVHAGGATLIDFLLSELKRFTGEGWEQEDDMTMLTLQRITRPLPVNEQQEERPVHSS
jgi:serine phosphatase RsbU (regulator of sigma subunit)